MAPSPPFPVTKNPDSVANQPLRPPGQSLQGRPESTTPPRIPIQLVGLRRSLVSAVTLTTMPDKSLAGKKITVLVEADYIPAEIKCYQRRFASYGAEGD